MVVTPPPRDGTAVTSAPPSRGGGIYGRAIFCFGGLGLAAAGFWVFSSEFANILSLLSLGSAELGRGLGVGVSGCFLGMSFG